MPKKLLRPEGARDFLVRRYNHQHQNWLAGEGSWPLSVNLGAPIERDVAEDPGYVREWIAAWSAWKGPAEVVWEVRRWPRLGTQQLPVRLVVQAPAAVATILGQNQRWSVAVERFRRMTARWPALAHSLVLASKFDGCRSHFSWIRYAAKG